MQLKKRYIKVTIGEAGLQTEYISKQAPGYMRIDFEIKKYVNTATFGMSTANIELYNISSDKIRTFIAKDLPVIVEAGYENSSNIIFNGRIGTAINIKKSPDSPNVITNLLCNAGLKNIQQYVVSFATDTIELKDFLVLLCRNIQIEDSGILKNANVEPVFIKDIEGNDIQGTINEQIFDNDLISVLKKISSEFAFDFQIGENNILFRPRQEKPIIEIKPENGLIGIPEITELGIDLKVFLNPGLESGDVFNLTSKFSNFKLGALEFLDRTDVGSNFNARKVNNNNRYQGTYQIISLIHKGSSHSSEWQSEIVARNYLLDSQSFRDK